MDWRTARRQKSSRAADLIVLNGYSDLNRDECGRKYQIANVGLLQLLHTPVIVNALGVPAPRLMFNAIGCARICHGRAVWAMMGIFLHIAKHAVGLLILTVFGNIECHGAGLHGQAQPDHAPARQHAGRPVALLTSNVSY